MPRPTAIRIDKAEEGLASDILALVLSPASCPVRWERDRWEPVLFDEAQNAGVKLVCLLLADCPYPKLLQRGVFSKPRQIAKRQCGC
jgi:hypothetical protein